MLAGRPLFCSPNDESTMFFVDCSDKSFQPAPHPADLAGLWAGWTRAVEPARWSAWLSRGAAVLHPAETHQLGVQPPGHDDGLVGGVLPRVGAQSPKETDRMTVKDHAVPTALRSFLGTVFAPPDIVLVRPIEIWVEADGAGARKRSRVVYKQVRHVRADKLASDPKLWAAVCQAAEEEKANLFFGVCPRTGGGQQYDLAWQVRTVRVLWADLDGCTPEEAMRRCADAGLPRPSIIVRSGNGCHLYWLLTTPLLIDDTDPPRPVFKEFRDQGEGKKKEVLLYTKATNRGKNLRVPDQPKNGEAVRHPQPRVPHPQPQSPSGPKGRGRHRVQGRWRPHPGLGPPAPLAGNDEPQGRAQRQAARAV